QQSQHADDERRAPVGGPAGYQRSRLRLAVALMVCFFAADRMAQRAVRVAIGSVHVLMLHRRHEPTIGSPWQGFTLASRGWTAGDPPRQHRAAPLTTTLVPTSPATDERQLTIL